jgi:hypothetical protein
VAAVLAVAKKGDGGVGIRVYFRERDLKYLK